MFLSTRTWQQIGDALGVTSQAVHKKYGKFTRAAREVVTNAVEFAGDRGDPRIGTEHPLAGVAATSSPAADLLDRVGAGSQQVRTAISDLDRSALAAVGIDQDSIRLGLAGNEWLRRKRHIPFKRAAKAVLEGALHQGCDDEASFDRVRAHPGCLDPDRLRGPRPPGSGRAWNRRCLVTPGSIDDALIRRASGDLPA